MQYRADIDGLRALAVLPVVAFHAGLPGFPGGFVGVDVFFVISGFLITSIILEEVRDGRFSLLGFYERRCRRILPALFVVTAATAGLASWILVPGEFERFGVSLVAASLFVSSFHFSGEPGYFDRSSDFAPLLHTWSLSVEEIFYVVFPLLMVLLFRPRAGAGRWILLGLGILSFLAAAHALAQNPASRTAFYFPHARAWELLLGSMAALFPLLGPRLAGIAGPAAAAGVAMIAASVVLYSQDTVFPGPAALLPCLGCWLVIVAGGARPSLVSRLLANPVLVWIGRASFSLYLWHWPLLVMMRTVRGGPLGNLDTAQVLAAAAVLSGLTLFLVERPFRGKDGILPRRWIFALAAGGTLALAGFGAFATLSGGWPGRYSGAEWMVVEAARDVDPRRYACLQSTDRDTGCRYGAPGRPPTVGLWGDSHAAMYAPALGEMARRRGTAVAVFTMSSCAPVYRHTGPDHPWGAACRGLQARALETFIATDSIKTVILAARWRGHGLPRANPGLDAALRETIARLIAAGKQVAIVYPVPEYGQDVPQALTNRLLAGGLPAELSIDRDNFEEAHRDEAAYLDSLPAGLLRLHPAARLCDAAKCYFLRNGQVYSHDAHHLSVTGARKAAPVFSPVFGKDGA